MVVGRPNRSHPHRAVASAAILAMLYVRRNGQTPWLSPNWSSSAKTWWPRGLYTPVVEQCTNADASWWCSIRMASPPLLARRSRSHSLDLDTAKLRT